MNDCKENMSHHTMEDHGPELFAANIPCAAGHNHTFRTAYWTGKHLQMTLMCIPPCGEIGIEMHPDTDQLIRVEQGSALAVSGTGRDCLNCRRCLNLGDTLFVPAGTYHNIINTGRCPLRLSSVYAPPQHPRGTIHCTKEDSDRT